MSKSTVRLKRIGDYMEATDNESAMVLRDECGCVVTRRGDRIWAGFHYQDASDYLYQLERSGHNVELLPGKF